MRDMLGAPAADENLVTAIRLTNVMPSSPSDYEIDKIPGAWVITCWLQTEIVLRMKFVYLERDEEVEIQCEIRLRDRNEWRGCARTDASG